MSLTTTPRLVLIHGLFSSPQEFALLARILQARRVDFDCLEIPGYTSGTVVEPGDWHAWVASAERAIDDRYPLGTSIVVAGLCVGGAIAAALAARDQQNRICGVVMMSPTFEYDGWSIRLRTRWRRVAYRTGLDRWLSVSEREPYGIKDPKMRGRVAREVAAGGSAKIGPVRLPLRGIRETERLYAAVRPCLSGLEVPLLVIHAREDEIATVASVKRAMGPPRSLARLLVVDDSYHMITLDNDRQQVAHALADFVGAPAPQAWPAMSPALLAAKAARLHRLVKTKDLAHHEGTST